jgi:hypothetical protein
MLAKLAQDALRYCDLVGIERATGCLLEDLLQAQLLSDLELNHSEQPIKET